MFKSKTVFVIGAGASREVDLPVGGELTEKISNLLYFPEVFDSPQVGDRWVSDAVQRLVNQRRDDWQIGTLLGSAQALRQAMEMATSIDTFLESHAENRELVLLGKLGIARAISNGESSSKLVNRDRTPIRISSLSSTWYVGLAQQLFAGVPARAPSRAFENVSFIVFNYDRCLQYYLVLALKVYFGMDEREAMSLVREITILHPYGSLGDVFPGTPNHLPFAASSYDLIDLANRIYTFSEKIADAEALSKIRSEVASAETLVFLGTGFHPQNMDLLTGPINSVVDSHRNAKVFATTKGLSKPDTQVVRGMLSNLVWQQPESGLIKTSIHTFEGTCREFFAEYWRSLTAA